MSVHAARSTELRAGCETIGLHRALCASDPCVICAHHAGLGSRLAVSRVKRVCIRSKSYAFSYTRADSVCHERPTSGSVDTRFPLSWEHNSSPTSLSHVVNFIWYGSLRMNPFCCRSSLLQPRIIAELARTSLHRRTLEYWTAAQSGSAVHRAVQFVRLTSLTVLPITKPFVRPSNIPRRDVLV